MMREWRGAKKGRPSKVGHKRFRLFPRAMLPEPERLSLSRGDTEGLLKRATYKETFVAR
ncbi:hypothetical protein PSAB6_390010 [Paraburkholderia sabiae]|nr:hypothetical protein PSAB6_390010 [Paraburkholderia sabiae]